MKKKITVPEIRAAKSTGRKFSMVTCYDYSSARLLDMSDVEMALVGDSLGMVMRGMSSTVGVTLDDVIYYTKSVVRGAPNTFVVGDMPFGTYNGSIEKAVENATRLFAESGCDAIKMEGGATLPKYLEAVHNAGIPVFAHIGLTPQAVSMMGGFKVQGKSAQAAHDLVELAKACEAAGAFCLNVEGVPMSVGKKITESIGIPMMGIGAGPYCDSQDLVWFDLLGFNETVPKFVKKYANLGQTIVEALNKFNEEVNTGAFPTIEYSYTTKVDGFDDSEESIDGLYSAN